MLSSCHLNTIVMPSSCQDACASLAFTCEGRYGLVEGFNNGVGYGTTVALILSVLVPWFFVVVVLTLGTLAVIFARARAASPAASVNQRVVQPGAVLYAPSPIYI